MSTAPRPVHRTPDGRVEHGGGEIVQPGDRDAE
jgi:hypothetical protein